MHLMQIGDIRAEIEKGFAAVSEAAGEPIAPFFRFPGFRDSPEAVAYLASRNISIWSVDVVSGDVDPGATPARIARDTVERIERLGKGIILFHDIKKFTAEALDGILVQLEKDGYKFVHVVSNTSYQPDPKLLANPEIFRPRTADVAMTGRRTMSNGGAEINDGSVAVLHNEWIDLDSANAGRRAPEQQLPSIVPEAGE